MQLPGVLFHYTPEFFLGSILSRGLEPKNSRGLRRRVWLAAKGRVKWAMRHVADHQQVSPASLACLAVLCSGLPLQRTGRPGVYSCPVLIEPWRLRVCVTGPAWGSLCKADRGGF